MPIFQLIKNQVITKYWQPTRPGGIVIFKLSVKKHLDYNSKNEKVGGPKDLDTLFSIDEIKSDFQNFEVLELEEKKFNLTKDNFTTV
jgi:hypothetical protein